MNKLMTAGAQPLRSVCAALPAFAADRTRRATPRRRNKAQQDKMKACNTKAGGQEGRRTQEVHERLPVGQAGRAGQGGEQDGDVQQADRRAVGRRALQGATRMHEGSTYAAVPAKAAGAPAKRRTIRILTLRAKAYI